MSDAPPNLVSFTPKRRWFRFTLRTLFVAVTLVSLVLAYAGSYHRISRLGLKEAQAQGWGDMNAFWYVPQRDIEDRSRHYRLRTLYAPANFVDCALFGGPSPAQGGTWALE
jgi:hypothetical protein